MAFSLTVHLGLVFIDAKYLCNEIFVNSIFNKRSYGLQKSNKIEGKEQYGNENPHILRLAKAKITKNPA